MEKKQAHDAFFSFLKQGFRITPQRFEILDFALAFEKHFKAEELFVKMQNNGSKVSRATIYNTLELLVQCELLSRRVFEHNITMYESNFQRKQHDHIICEECGKIWEFVEPEIQEIVNRVGRKFNLEPHSYVFNIYAKCQNSDNCKEKTSV